jgi:hypothetical protein
VLFLLILNPNFKIQIPNASMAKIVLSIKFEVLSFFSGVPCLPTGRFACFPFVFYLKLNT